MIDQETDSNFLKFNFREKEEKSEDKNELQDVVICYHSQESRASQGAARENRGLSEVSNSHSFGLHPIHAPHNPQVEDDLRQAVTQATQGRQGRGHPAQGEAGECAQETADLHGVRALRNQEGPTRQAARRRPEQQVQRGLCQAQEEHPRGPQRR